MLRSLLPLASLILTAVALQSPLLRHSTGRSVSVALFSELEELARIVDISYCVGLISAGISKPFSCLSRCSDFPQFELVTTWNTGPLLSDSCGYIALDHGKQRIIVAFRGTYSIANTIIDLSTIPQKYVPYPGDDSDVDVTTTGTKCTNCSVHMGFYSSWVNTRRSILPDLQQQIFLYPHYALYLVGHSLGGAVAALAGLDFVARGWQPTVTSFGEPRVGNTHLVEYIDVTFKIGSNHSVPDNDTELKYRRVTHVDDPVPLLPLTEWGYAMHAGEIYISKSSLSPNVADLQHCSGDNDVECIAGQDSSTSKGQSAKRDLLRTVRNEIEDVRTESWGIPSRYKLWELFFSHRDYFWRLGVCLPGGDPLGPGKLVGSPKVDL